MPEALPSRRTKPTPGKETVIALSSSCEHKGPSSLPHPGLDASLLGLLTDLWPVPGGLRPDLREEKLSPSPGLYYKQQHTKDQVTANIHKLL